ncbi:hypothetical protein FGB62_160g016 [Gracilaria domingensis]|nr:hypothetical protein FGB62_160g016 [Gracilaria domingensis]
MRDSSPCADPDALRERQLAADLQSLRREREEIKAAFNATSSPLFDKLLTLCLKRLQIAADHRALQLENLRANFHLQVQQAYNEFECGKRRLRRKMLKVNMDRRRRLDAMKGGRKKRKRSRNYFELRASKKTQVSPFLSELGKQGMLRVEVTPDELMADMNDLLTAIELPMRKSSSHMGRVEEVAVVGDKLQASKGAPRFHD